MTSIYTQENMLFHTTFYVTNRSAECGITVNPAQDPQSTPEPSTLISLGLLSLGAYAAKRKAS